MPTKERKDVVDLLQLKKKELPEDTPQWLP